MRPLTCLSLALAALTIVGCGSNKLETGYVYTPLGSTPSQRRAYYAGPFSAEAREAMRSGDSTPGTDRRARRPGA